MRNAYKIFIGKSDEKRPLGRLWCRLEDNTERNLKAIG